MTILIKGELKRKYLLLLTESTFHSLSIIMNSNFYTPYRFIQISKDGKRKCNYTTKRRHSMSICMRL